MKSYEGLTPPRLIKQVDPKLSKKLRKSGRFYSVTVHFILDEKGVPVQAAIKLPADPSAKDAEQIEQVNKYALEAVKQYRFVPAMRGTEPVAVEMNVEVNFQPLRD